MLNPGRNLHRHLSEGNPSEYDSIYGREGPVSHIRVKVGIAGQYDSMSLRLIRANQHLYGQ